MSVNVEAVHSALLVMLLEATVDAQIEGYDEQVPTGAARPYWLLQSIPGGAAGYGPPLGDPDADLTLAFQLDAVGDRRDQAQLLAHRLRAVVLGRDPRGRLAHRLVLPPNLGECCRLASEPPAGVDVEGTPPNAVFAVPQRFAVAVTSSL